MSLLKKRTVAKVTRLLPNALSSRPRGRVDEETCPENAPETGAGSNVSAAFAPVRKNQEFHHRGHRAYSALSAALEGLRLAAIPPTRLCIVLMAKGTYTKGRF